MTWSRRHLLKSVLGGAACSLGLPHLSARANSEAAPKRVVVFFVPNGIHQTTWAPTDVGAGYALSPILEPLAPIRDKVTVITGLANRPAREPTVGLDHENPCMAALTCVNRDGFTGPRPEPPPHNWGVSWDQLLAQASGDATRFRSLALGSEPDEQPGRSNISWVGPITPAAKDIHPTSLFERLHQGERSTETFRERQRRIALSQSVLDFALDDLTSLSSRVGVEDKRRLEEYTTGLRELERRLYIDTPVACGGTFYPDDNVDAQTHVQLMLDLMVLALQCDQTRIITYMLGRSRSDRAFGFLGYPDTHHNYSHDPSASDALTAIGRWEVDRFAYLLRKLDAIAEGDGTLLDNTHVLLVGALGDGWNHVAADLPVLLAGGRAPTHGEHLVRTGEPIANLYLSLMQAQGLTMSQFGDDGTAPLLDLG